MPITHRLSAWLGRLSVGRKLMLIYLLDLTAVIYVSSILIHEKNEAIDFTRKETVGTAYASVVRDGLMGQFLQAPGAAPSVLAVQERLSAMRDAHDDKLHTAPASQRFSDALGRFATGVAVVTAVAPDGSKLGLTISSFNSASLSPPLVLWSLMKTASSMPVFQQISHYAVNVLGAPQKELALQFSRRNVDRWAGVDYQLGASGAPVLAGAIATFECHNRSQYDEGDHVILVGEVKHCRYQTGIAPLLYHGGNFYTEQLI